MNKKKYLYEEMPVLKAIITLAVPTILGQMIAVIYNMADTFFVGQLNDPAQLAAASISMPPFVLLSGVANLVGIGGASLISRSLGANNRDKAKQVAAFCIWTAGTIALCYGLLILFLKPWLLPLFGAKSTTYDYCYDYVFWTVTIGAVPTVMNVCLAHLVRSEGLSKHAAFGIAMGGVLNMLLDPLFIFVFHMQIRGAAMATALSNTLATIYFICVIRSRGSDTVINAKPSNYTVRDGIPHEVLMVGLPNFITYIMSMVSNMVLNNLMTGHSDMAMAGMGIAKKIDMLTFAVSQGTANGVLSLIAYNYASKNYKRMVKSIKTSFLFSETLAILTTLFLFFCAVPVARFFIDNAQTVAFGQHYLRILCLICPMQAISMLIIACFQAIGEKKRPLILSFMRKGTVDTPIMLLMNMFIGVMGIAWAMPGAEFASSIVAVCLFIPIFKRLNKLAHEQGNEIKSL